MHWQACSLWTNQINDTFNSISERLWLPFLNEGGKNFWKIKLALRFWGKICLTNSSIITVRLLLPENGWFWQHVRMRAIKSWFVCHRTNCIRGIEFLSFLPALNPRPEHHPIQISQTGPVHTIHAHSSHYLLLVNQNHTWPHFWPGTHS